MEDKRIKIHTYYSLEGGVMVLTGGIRGMLFGGLHNNNQLKDKLSKESQKHRKENNRKMASRKTLDGKYLV